MNNNVVKADAMEKPAQSNNAKGGQQGVAGEANGTQGDQQQGKSTNGVGEQQNGTQTAGSTNGKIPTPANSGTGTATDEKAPQGDSTTNPVAKPDSENLAVKVQHAGTKEDAHQITESHDNLDPQKEIDIDATNSTEWDAVKYIKDKYGKNIHIKIDDSDVEYDFISTVRDKNGKSVSYVEGPNRREGLVSMSLEDGDVIQVVAVPRQLDSNKWYSWTPVDNQFGSKGNQSDPINHAKKLMGGDRPDDIANRVVDDKTTGKLIEQTDEYGNLPTIVSAKNADGKIFNWVEIDLHLHLNSWFLKVLKK